VATISAIVNGHRNARLDERLPWIYPVSTALKAWPENSTYADLNLSHFDAHPSDLTMPANQARSMNIHSMRCFTVDFSENHGRWR
jgi:hypothetical protein